MLGTPSEGDKESYVQFDDSEFTTATDISFNLGNLTYRNGITVFGSEPEGDFPLNVTLSLTNPVPSTQTFNFSFNLTSTLNETDDPVKDGDILRFSDGTAKEQFTFKGIDYRLQLVGFSADSGKTTLGRFNTPEQRFSEAQLIGKIKQVSFLEKAAEGVIVQIEGATNAIKELPGQITDKIQNTIDDYNTRLANYSKGFLDGLYIKFTGLPSGLSQQRVAQNLQASAEPYSTFQITEAVMAQYPGGLLGTESNDNIIGSPATDVVLAAEGADTLEGAGEGNYLLGGKGDDRILGEDANDILGGNKGNDFVSGGVADDLVRGGKGNDQIFGDDGEDILIGERGTDRLTGGGGSDIFILRTDTGTEETNPATADWLIDFNASEGDRIGINGGVPIDILTFTPADVNQDGIADTIIQYTETSEIFGVYTNIFGVVINTQPDIVKSSSFSIPLNDPITQIGML
ncbi:choice-of-anchor K domain-containing protein [Microcoleus sp. Pol12A4]|uniref:choice-of-anchor K domain-containing protein n=1 Tax=unclassified Microcoleus TaxID=2642155 RepID=UPI002FD1A0C5